MRPWFSCKPAPIFNPEAWRGPTHDAAVPSRAQGKRDWLLGEDEGALLALARAVELRDRRTASHCERVAFLGVAIGMAMQFSRARLAALYQGGYLHDVGKVGIPDAILHKAGGLSAEEWSIMRTHPACGEAICRPVASFGPALPLIRHHHERGDGNGYPDGLRASQIPIEARVLQVADIYDALTSARPHKPAYTPAQSLQMLRDEAKCGWRDMEVVEVLGKMHGSGLPGIGAMAPPGQDLDGMRSSLDGLRAMVESTAG